MPDTQTWFDLNKPPVSASPQGNWFQQNSPTPDQGLQQAQESTADKVMSFLRPMIRPVVAGGLAGMAATTAFPLTGPIGSAVAGVGTYTAADLALKQAMGESKPTAAEDLTDTGINAITNEGGSALLRGLGGLLQKIPTVAKVSKRGQELATQITGGRPASEATDPYYLASNLKQNVTDAFNRYNNPPAVFEKNALSSLLQDEGNGAPLINRAVNIIKDPAKIQDVLDAGGIRIPGVGKIMSGNARQDLAGVALTQLSRMKPSDALGSLEDVNMKESYAKLFSQQTRANLEQLFKAGQSAETLAKVGRGATRVAMVFGGFGGLHVATSLFRGNLSGLGEAEGLVSGLVLGGRALAKVASNTPVSRALTRIAEGTAAGMSDEAISRMLVGALQGTGAAVSLVGADGTQTRGTIEAGPNGGAQFVPSQKQQPVEQPFVQP